MTAATCVCLLATAPAPAFDLDSVIERVAPGASGGAASSGSSLSQGQIADGLIAALGQGIERAVGTLGRTDGFLGNPQVRIPMPESLSTVESALRAVGQDRYADEFITAMNRAAEQAVPEALDVFGNALSRMSIDDARQILNGPDDAATRFFQRTSSEELVARFRPVVEQATNAAGVTSSYKQLVERAGPAASLFGSSATDIDGYVTDGAVDGLFEMIAAEEKRIRTQPAARGSEILRQVFGGG